MHQFRQDKMLNLSKAWLVGVVSLMRCKPASVLYMSEVVKPGIKPFFVFMLITAGKHRYKIVTDMSVYAFCSIIEPRQVYPGIAGWLTTADRGLLEETLRDVL